MNDKVDLRRQRVKLLVIFFLFLAPVLAAWVWNANLDRWRPGATVNHGELVTPARPLPAFDLSALDGSHITQDFLRGKWTMLYIGASDCARACRDNLYKMRQVRLALNEKMDRVQRLWVLTDATHAKALAGLLSEHPGLQVAAQSGAKLERFIAGFAVPGSASPASDQRIYYIDPLGNLMMSYPAGADAKGMLKDLQRLLLTSWVG